MNLKRYLTIYGALWRTSVAREMSFKGNFLLWILVEMLWFGLQLAFVGVIFSQTTTIGTWTVWQVVLLTGASNFIQQIYQAFFLVNCTNLSELVRTGKMDFLLRCRSTRASSSRCGRWTSRRSPTPRSPRA
jgi:ABC-2 type transport system permease protein